MIIMDHKVRNVQKFHDDVFMLKNSVVSNGDASADVIIENLFKGIENLKVNWKGKDAGVRINEVIKVYNAMVDVRNALDSLAADSSIVASNYREIQNANGAGLETFGTLHADMKPKLGEYTDNADTIDINPDALNGKNSIDMANSAIEQFETLVKEKYQDIMDNWMAGTGRDKAQQAFDNFNNNVAQYRQILSDASTKIKNALENYKL